MKRNKINKCSICKEEKGPENFYKSHQSRCKNCCRIKKSYKYVKTKVCKVCRNEIEGFNFIHYFDYRINRPYSIDICVRCGNHNVKVDNRYLQEYVVEFENIDEAISYSQPTDLSLLSIFKLINFIENVHPNPRFFDNFDVEIQIELMIKWIKHCIKLQTKIK